MNDVPQANRIGSKASSLRIALCTLLAFLTLLAYWEVQGNEFVYYDDHSYITENPRVKAGLTLEGIGWAFTSSHSFNWHPLTWISHMLDVELYGLNPAGHHWNSLLLHLANTLLLFLLFHRMTGSSWRSGMVAALFSLHPLHVESVAWASERKDVLCTLFWMLAMLSYVSYTRKREWKRYSLALFLFGLGLLSKPMVVTLPFALLLLDFWPLRRYTGPGEGGGLKRFLHLCREKVPFFVFSALIGIVTFFVQKTYGAVADELSLVSRISNALVSYVRYIFKTLWPSDLTCFYPHPVGSLGLWQVLGAFLILSAATWLVFRLRRSSPHLLVGWLWYLVTLLPVIGLVQVGEQAIADRYTYIPLIGLFLMACWSIPSVSRRTILSKWALGASTGAILLILLSLTRGQAAHWRDTLSLFRHEVQVSPESPMAHFHLATALEAQGRQEEAKEEYAEALRIRPGFQVGHYQLGNLLNGMGRPLDAIGHFQQAVALNPRDYKAHNNLGSVLLREGRFREAAHHFSEALRNQPGDGMLQRNLGLALQRMQEADRPPDSWPQNREKSSSSGGSGEPQASGGNG